MSKLNKPGGVYYGMVREFREETPMWDEAQGAGQGPRGADRGPEENPAAARHQGIVGCPGENLRRQCPPGREGRAKNGQARRRGHPGGAWARPPATNVTKLIGRSESRLFTFRPRGRGGRTISPLSRYSGRGVGGEGMLLPSPGTPGEGSGVRACCLPSPGTPGEGSGVRACCSPLPVLRERGRG